MANKETLLTDYLVAEQARFYRLAYSYLHNREEALDAVQTAVCRALEHQDRLRNPAALPGWFGRILVNACTDTLRQRKRTLPLEDREEAAWDPEPEDESLARRVEALPVEQGTVIRLRFYEDLSLREISEITGCSVNTVKTRLYAGLRKLRVEMKGDDLE